jgi:hypothetical protein
VLFRGTKRQVCIEHYDVMRKGVGMERLVEVDGTGGYEPFG